MKQEPRPARAENPRPSGRGEVKILFAAAHALYALDASDPVLGTQAAREIRDAWDDGGGVGEWLWEHLGGAACEEIGPLADELVTLEKAAQAIPENAGTKEPTP